MSDHHVTLRPASCADAQFACEVMERTMKRHAIATWGRWPEDEVRAAAREDACLARSQIILVDGSQAGVLRVDSTPTHVQLEQLFLLPAYQRKGVGEHILGLVLSQARAAGLPVRLRVLRANAEARDFYARHGFLVTTESGERFFMEWAP